MKPLDLDTPNDYGPALKPSASHPLSGGGTIELWIDGHAPHTVYVDNTGWRHTSWWSSPDIARVDFESTVKRVGMGACHE